MACKECIKTKRDTDEKKLKENLGVTIASVLLTILLIGIIIWMMSSDFQAYQIASGQTPLNAHQLLEAVAIVSAITGMEIGVVVLSVEGLMKHGVAFGRKYPKIK